MLIRSLAIASVLILSGWLVHGGAHAEATRQAGLEQIPLTLGEWTGTPEPPFDDETLRVLGADEYVNRTYVDDARHAGGINLYVAYYASQRQGDAIHSPMNCLPGTGWQPVSRGRLRIDGAAAPFEANRVLVQKGRERQLVLYWYEGRGRRVASEYASKLYLSADAVRLNRTDGALVRLSIPVTTSEQDTERRVLAFAAALNPALERTLSSASEDPR